MLEFPEEYKRRDIQNYEIQLTGEELICIVELGKYYDDIHTAVKL